MEPEPGLLRPFLATYDNASLGRISLRLDGHRVVLDAGEWKSAVGRKRGADGTIKLVLLDPPWAYFELEAVAGDGQPRLVLQRPQHTYVFQAMTSTETGASPPR